MTTVEMLRAWYEARSTGEQGGLLFELSFGEQGTSAWLDVEGEQAVGRATVWNGGSCDIEAIRVADTRQLAYLHTQVRSRDDLDAVLGKLLCTVQEYAASSLGG